LGTGTVSSTTTTLPVSPTTRTSYWVRATSDCGSEDSAVAVVLFCTAPSITGQPQSSTSMTRGMTTTLSVTANQTDATYQWYSGTSGNGTLISGATKSTLDISPTPAATPYNYWVKVTNSCGDATNSSTAQVSVFEVPGPPTTFSATFIPGTLGTTPTVQILWGGGTTSAAIDHFEIVRSSNAGPFVRILSPTPSQSTASDTNVTPGVTY